MNSNGNDFEQPVDKERAANKRDPFDIFGDPEDKIGQIIGKANRMAVTRHRKLGQSIVIWRDGKVVTLPPEEIPIYDDCE